MRLLLDTTYLLPAIGIGVKGIPRDAPLKLIESGHNISISEITIFELVAKGAKYITAGKLNPERVSGGVKAIVYDERIMRHPIYDSTILLTAFRLRRYLRDFIDCLILSSAINRSETLVTEDKDILYLGRRGEFKELIQTLNQKFEIKTLKEILTPSNPASQA